MLIILYAISVIASWLMPVFVYRKQYRNVFKLLAVALVSATLYIIFTIVEICTDLSNLRFWTVFGIVSLIIVDISLMFNNVANLVSYLITAICISGLLCCINSINLSTSYLIRCNENHDYIERIQIVTTVDGTEFGESIYGEGFVVAEINSSAPYGVFYQYNLLSESGNVISKEIGVKRTEITYIDDNAEPYLEVCNTVKCSGYRKNSQHHVTRIDEVSYHLYIPKDSIISIYSSK